MIDAAPPALVVPLDASLTETKLLTDLDWPRRVVPWFDAVPLPLVGFDSAGLIAIWNSAATDLFGWTAPEAVGTVGAFIPDDLRPVHRTHLDRQLLVNLDAHWVRRIALEGLDRLVKGWRLAHPKRIAGRTSPFPPSYPTRCRLGSPSVSFRRGGRLENRGFRVDRA